MTGILVKNGNLETHTHTHTHTQEGHHVKMKAGWTFLQAKECQRFPANHQKLEEKHGTDFPSQSSEGINLANTLISNFISIKWVLPPKCLIDPISQRPHGTTKGEIFNILEAIPMQADKIKKESDRRGKK